MKYEKIDLENGYIMYIEAGLSEEENRKIRYELFMADYEMLCQAREAARDEKMRAIQMRDLNAQGLQMNEELLNGALATITFATLCEYGIGAVLSTTWLVIILKLYAIPGCKLAKNIYKRRAEKLNEVVNIISDRAIKRYRQAQTFKPE